MSSLIKKVLFLFPFAAISIYAIFCRLNIPFVPIESMDEYQYLLVSIDTNKGLDSGMTLPYYQLIVLFFTRLFHSLSGVIVFSFLLFLGELVLSIFLFNFLYEKFIKNYSVFHKFIYYLLSLGTFFVFFMSSSKIHYEFCLRPETVSMFFELVFVYLFSLFWSDSKNKKISIIKFIIIANFLALLIQPKFVFLFIFNILLSGLMFWREDKKNFVTVFNFFLKTLIIFIIIARLVSLIIIRVDFHKMLYTANIFWRNYDSIHKYVEKDLNNQNFNKYDKNILNDFTKIYENKKDLYDKKRNINISELDKITYTDSFEYMHKYNPVALQKIYNYYLFKSFILSPNEYLIDYLNEWKKIYNKEQKLFLIESDPLVRDDYIYERDWFSKWYEGKQLPYVTSHIEDVKKVVDKNYNLKKISFLSTVEQKMNQYYFWVISLYLVVLILKIILKKKDKFNFLDKITIYTAAANFLLYSFTAFFFVNLERYVSEVLPLSLFSLFFALLALFFMVFEGVSVYIKSWKSKLSSLGKKLCKKNLMKSISKFWQDL